MKHNITPLLAFFVVTFFYSNGQSQDWFSIYSQGEKINGFVVGMAGDTLPGNIQYDYPIIMQKKVTLFSLTSDIDEVKYSPSDIRSYHIGEKNWISSDVMMDTYNGLFKFSRFGILISQNGPISLIRFYDELDKHKKNINSEEADLIMNKIPLNQEVESLKFLYISKSGTTAEKVDSKEFKKDFINKMTNYIGDNEVLLLRIKNKELTVKNIYQIVEDYNSRFNSNIRNQ